MTKIQMTSPRPRRIGGLSNMDMAVIAYFAARPGTEIGYASVELWLAGRGFKRPQYAKASCSELAHKGYLKPLGLGRYQFRTAA
jgi:hypothetical protein